MANKVIYNMVTEAGHYMCQKGELLTDKELTHLFEHMPWRKPKVTKVQVFRRDCYISFGARFLIDGRSYETVSA